MNEYQRQAYLGALGLEQYVPRWQLPCAPEPVVVTLPELEPEPETVPASVEPAQSAHPGPGADPNQLQEAPATRAAPQALTDVLRDMSLPAEQASGEAPDAAPRSDAVAPEAEPVAPFSLSIWRSSLPLLVLDARQPRSAMPTERLLRNLLSALSAPGADPQSRAETNAWEEILPWPSVNNPAMHQRAEDARAELHTWLEIELSQRPVKHMLLLGENAARFFLPQGTHYQDVLWQSLALTPFGCSALVAPSLLELLQQPGLKRDLWEASQPLLPL